jgi:hypothetical protein
MTIEVADIHNQKHILTIVSIEDIKTPHKDTGKMVPVNDPTHSREFGIIDEEYLDSIIKSDDQAVINTFYKWIINNLDVEDLVDVEEPEVSWKRWRFR